MPSAQGHITVSRVRRGADGRGVVSQTDYYAVSASKTAAPTEWTAASPPAMTAELRYLWRYTRTVFTDGGVESTEPCVIGVYGVDGLSYRYSRWASGVEYRNDNSPYFRDSNGQGVIDVVLKDDITIYDPATGGSPPAAYICRKTHTSRPAVEFTSEGGWTRDGDTFTSDAIAAGGATWARIGFRTYEDGSVVKVKITASSEANYDWGYVCGLDKAYSTDDYLAKVSGTDSRTVEIGVRAQGVHYFYVGYTKDASNDGNNDNAVVEILSVSPAAVPLAEGEYWSKMNSTAPVLTALVLAHTIKAESLDVADLAADAAFVSKLTANTAFIDELNSKAIRAGEIETADSGDGFLQMRDNVLQMFGPDGDERLKVHGGDLSSLDSQAYNDPSAEKVVSRSHTFVYGGETSWSAETVICERTIASDLVLTVPRIDLALNCDYSEDSGAEPESAVSFQYVAELLIDGVVHGAAYMMARYGSGSVIWDGGGAGVSSAMHLSRTKANVGAGAHTVKVRITLRVLGGMPEGSDICQCSAAGSVAANAVTWARSIRKTEVANDGFRVALASNVYFSASLSGSSNVIEMRNGNFGLKITDSGLYKMTDGTWETM